MKILHSADWHLGHQLHGYARHYEHQQFLDWLLLQIDTQLVDVLVICGDVFDTANPSAASWEQLYSFLAKAATRNPGLQVIVTAGNHDSPSKLNAPSSLISHFDLHFVGSVVRHENGELDNERLLIPLKTRDGQIQGWCIAAPFLRSSDLQLDPRIEDSSKRWQNAIQSLYAELGEAVDKRLEPEHCLIALGHGHVSGGQISELSERHVMIGGQHALPTTIFPERCDYVALGHLHLAQQIKSDTAIFYSGSPIPLSISERNYKHQIKLVEFEERQLKLEPIYVPRVCDLLRVPKTASDFDSVLQALRDLEPFTGVEQAKPYLEVVIKLDKPQAQIRERVLEAIQDKNLRLAKISIEYSQGQQDTQFAKSGQKLSQLCATEVFELCYQQQYQDQLDPKLMAAFQDVLTQVEQSDL
ncbi:exonuclease subunit SbcD [Alginatibacterium sediminis]|uniref:Nuclease SbcCD subunit D n=1 Tax=Alginatibacterium sediminis TaxID=2164068 RepID=A0A420E9W3_9ALTE|nr:exonuclease SbcCD subunit D C-terminal domain-containing protein [Alginatibacterium sediminis]RKF17462.1 exonuclease subunit SbcD [Alginatibacterium sediminis]